MSNQSSLRGTTVRALLSAVALAGAASTALAQDDAADLATFTCKQIMASAESDRDLAIAMMHGYLLGTQGTTLLDPEALSAASEAFIDHCLDNPTHKALESLTKVTKS